MKSIISQLQKLNILITEEIRQELIAAGNNAKNMAIGLIILHKRGILNKHNRQTLIAAGDDVISVAEGLAELDKYNLMTEANRQTLIAAGNNANIISWGLLNLTIGGILNDQNSQAILTAAHNADVVARGFNILHTSEILDNNNRQTIVTAGVNAINIANGLTILNNNEILDNHNRQAMLKAGANAENVANGLAVLHGAEILDHNNRQTLIDAGTNAHNVAKSLVFCHRLNIILNAHHHQSLICDTNAKKVAYNLVYTKVVSILEQEGLLNHYCKTIDTLFKNHNIFSDIFLGINCLARAKILTQKNLQELITLGFGAKKQALTLVYNNICDILKQQGLLTTEHQHKLLTIHSSIINSTTIDIQDYTLDNEMLTKGCVAYNYAVNMFCGLTAFYNAGILTATNINIIINEKDNPWTLCIDLIYMHTLDVANTSSLAAEIRAIILPPNEQPEPNYMQLFYGIDCLHHANILTAKNLNTLVKAQQNNNIKHIVTSLLSHRKHGTLTQHILDNIIKQNSAMGLSFLRSQPTQYSSDDFSDDLDDCDDLENNNIVRISVTKLTT